MSWARRAAVVLWPAFLMAGVLEVLVFAFVDPATLQWVDGERLRWSSQAVHSVAFLVFWGVIAASATLTTWLGAPPDEQGGAAR